MMKDRIEMYRYTIYIEKIFRQKCLTATSKNDIYKAGIVYGKIQ